MADSDGWCCVDCLMLFANGETPTEMDEAETEAWLAEIERRTEGRYVALGDSDEDGQTFSWLQCDTCGSQLGGSRHAVTLFGI